MKLTRRKSPEDAAADGQRESATSSQVTRRRLLTALAAAGASAALGTTMLARSSAPAPTSDGEDAGPQWAFVIDLRRCDGCEKRTKACVETHHLNRDQTWIKVYERKSTSGQTYYMPRLCMQCQNPPCVRVLPRRRDVQEQGRRRARESGSVHRLSHVHGRPPLRGTLLQLD